MADNSVPFFAFRDYPVGMEQEVKAAVLDAMESRSYILGEPVSYFETAFADFLDTSYAVGVGNGLDALTMALKATGIGVGDEVILPANTFIATANAVMQTGALPVFAEPDVYTYNLKAEAIEGKLTARTKAVVPVHLYGQPCEMDAIVLLAESMGIKVIEDVAQAHGATYKHKKAGTWGLVGAFSFYPTKNLGAIGDAGAVVTQDAAIAGFIKKYRNYGELHKYQDEVIGVNSRLDTLQASVLQIKLKYLPILNAARQRLAAVYHSELSNTGDLTLPFTAQDCTHVYHIFNIRTSKRDELQTYLKQQGIQTAIHYPVHVQPAYKFLGYSTGDFPVAEELAATSLSLPIYPGMKQSEQAEVIKALKAFFY